MSALVLLMLASAELTPPPVVEAASENPVKAPEVVEKEAPPEPELSALEWNLGAQISVSLVQSLNGLFLGAAVCGAISCYTDPSLPFVVAGAGALAGLGYSFLDQEVSLGWGRASLFNSLTVAAALGSIGLVAVPGLGLASLGQVPAYTILFLADVALVAGAAVLSRNVAPRAEAVWLTDSLGLWGILLGDSAATLLGAVDRSAFVIGGVLAGAVTGALLAASAQRLSVQRFLIANVAALAGALVLGGALTIYEGVVTVPGGRPYNPAVPAAGVAAGIAGGFLIGFALSESL